MDRAEIVLLSAMIGVFLGFIVREIDSLLKKTKLGKKHQSDVFSDT